MSDVVKHWFVSPEPDGLNPAELQPSGWNREHIFAGGNHGDLLVRDTGASDGAGWSIGPHMEVSFSGDWLVFNRTENTPTTSIGISFGEKGSTVYALGLDYQSSQLCLWFPAVGDVLRVAPNGQMVMGGGVGDPTLEACQIVFVASNALNYVMGWGWKNEVGGRVDVAWLSKTGILSLNGLAPVGSAIRIASLKANSGKRILAIDANGDISSETEVPSGT